MPRKFKRFRRNNPVIANLDVVMRMQEIALTIDAPPEMLSLARDTTSQFLLACLMGNVNSYRKNGAWNITGDRAGQLCDLYVIASFVHYAHDTSMMIDAEYDSLCSYLYSNYLLLPKKTRVGYGIQKTCLQAGTGYRYTDLGDYPSLSRMMPAILSYVNNNGELHE